MKKKIGIVQYPGSNCIDDTWGTHYKNEEIINQEQNSKKRTTQSNKMHKYKHVCFKPLNEPEIKCS